jgi:hypothetical protein
VAIKINNNVLSSEERGLTITATHDGDGIVDEDCPP